MPLNFYDDFHAVTSGQKTIIKNDNFTYRNILRELIGVFPTSLNLSILDYGSGAGTIDLYLASLGSSVDGFDISGKAVAAANKSAIGTKLNHKARFYESRKFAEIAKGKKYDLILCTEVIEHLEDDRGTLKKLVALLRPKGILFITTPSLNAPLYKLGLSKGFDVRVGHLRRYNPKTLPTMIEGLGMKIEKVVKTEGIIRNSLFLIWPLGELIRFIRGPISDLVTFLDDLTVPIFGESDIMVIARKP